MMSSGAHNLCYGAQNLCYLGSLTPGETTDYGDIALHSAILVFRSVLSPVITHHPKPKHYCILYYHTCTSCGFVTDVRSSSLIVLRMHFRGPNTVIVPSTSTFFSTHTKAHSKESIRRRFGVCIQTKPPPGLVRVFCVQYLSTPSVLP
jgi:hypothetical protein